MSPKKIIVLFFLVFELVLRKKIRNNISIKQKRILKKVIKTTVNFVKLQNCSRSKHKLEVTEKNQTWPTQSIKILPFTSFKDNTLAKLQKLKKKISILCDDIF